MPTAPQSVNENRLLAALPAEEYERMRDGLEPIELHLSQILFRPGDLIDYVYFPTSSVISLLTAMEEGGGVEAGLVGREGMAGISVILGGRETKVATVQMDGMALRMKAGQLHEEFRRGATLHTALLRYTHALMTQISQAVVCNTRHKVPARLARWLLMFHDRAETDEFRLTQEFIANMLGVRRSGVSMAAERLQEMGLINYHRGHIRIVDRKALEEFACECYPAIKEKFDEFIL